MEANERQKARMKARQHAMHRLKEEYPDRFKELYNEELDKFGIRLEWDVVVIKRA